MHSFVFLLPLISFQLLSESAHCGFFLLVWTRVTLYLVLFLFVNEFIVWETLFRGSVDRVSFDSF